MPNNGFFNVKHYKEKMFAIIRQGNKQYRVSEGDTPVSYTHLTLPTNREV